MAKTRAGVARALGDPAYREKRRECGRKYGAKNIAATRGELSRRKAGKAISETKLAHIPPSLRDEYRSLIRNHVKKDEATRIVLEGAQAAARREIAKITEAQVRRREREMAEAY